jgi:hypothetical protein
MLSVVSAASSQVCVLRNSRLLLPSRDITKAISGMIVHRGPSSSGRQTCLDEGVIACAKNGKFDVVRWCMREQVRPKRTARPMSPTLPYESPDYDVALAAKAAPWDRNCLPRILHLRGLKGNIDPGPLPMDAYLLSRM